MKKVVLFICLLFFVVGCKKDSKSSYQTVNIPSGHNQDALDIIHKMSETLKNSNSKQFTLDVEDDVMVSENGKENITTVKNKNVIKAITPNKFYADLSGEKKNRTYFFNGDVFTFYNKDENNYVNLDVPGSTQDMIHYMHENFDINFPGGDFFYSSFKNDLKEFFPAVQTLENETIEGDNCTHIVAQNNELDMHLYITESTHLPKQLIIVDKTDGKNLKYKATFNNWELDKDINENMFVFEAPENANLISIMSKS